jgi:transposase
VCAGEKRGSLTGPSPVDRGKPGSKIHVLSDRGGLPLTVAVSAANTNDSVALKPLVMAILATRSQRGPRRRKPGKLHADKAYDHAELRAWVGDHGTKVRIARKGIESNEKLGRHRWVIERTMAWLSGIPAPDLALRTQSCPLPRLPHPRSRHHRPQKTPPTLHMRQALSMKYFDSKVWGARLSCETK